MNLTPQIFSFFLICNSVLADQNAPSQFSPVHQDYSTSIEEQLSPAPRKKKSSEMNLGSTVTLSWLPIPNAAYYYVIVSRDPELHDVAFSENSTNQQLLTSELAPGQYYYIVRGYNQKNLVGESRLDRFVVGSPLQISGKVPAKKLSSPTINGPDLNSTYASYTPIRFHWTRIEGSRGYRFRLWEIKPQPEEPKHHRHAFADESALNEKKPLLLIPDGPPRWVTEVTENWIEVRDAPYSSYMYLDTGDYRWDVAAVDKKTGRVGEVASSTFSVNRHMHLPEKQTDVRISNRFFPKATYAQSSAINHENFQEQTFRDALGLEADYFWNRRVGMRSRLDFDFFSLASSLYMAPSFSAELMYRSHLSPLPLGADFIIRTGLEFFRFPHLESLGGVITQTLTAAGPRLGFDYEQKMESLLFQTGATVILPLYFTAPVYSEESLYPTLNYNLYLRGLFVLSQSKWSWGPELSLQHRNLKFAPIPSSDESNVGWANNISLGIVFQFRGNN